MFKYISPGFYFVRQAVLQRLDIDKNPLMDESNQLKDICQNPAFRQAILCASESLYHSMNDYIDDKIKNVKRKRQIELSLSQYWMRMSTRATPFGLFSAVSIGDMSQSCENNRPFRAIIDADYEWIWSLSKLLEHHVFVSLTFVSNGLISEHKTSYSLPYIPGCSGDSPISIKKTIISSYLIGRCCHEACSYQDLWRRFQKNHPEIERFLFDEAIHELLTKDFLISELRPNLSSSNQIHKLISKLESKDCCFEIINQLKSISSQMDYVSEHVFEIEAEKYLLSIISLMRKLNDTKHVIKADLVNDSQTNVLCDKDVQVLTDFANYFISLAAYSQERFTIYDEYKDSYYNRYGDFQLVQLIKMLDEQKGLGLPQDYKEYKRKRRGEKTYPVGISTSLIQCMLSKYREAVQKNTTIEVEDVLSYLDLAKNTGKLPSSFDLIFKIASDDSGKRVFVCNKDFGCIGAGKTIGRFALNWEAATNAILKLNKSEQEEYLDCDLIYLPQRIHLGNVATSPNIHDYYLSFYQYSKNQSIPISDIYVGIENDIFFLYSKHLGKKLRVNTSNLLYYYGDTPVIRFLKEIQSDGVVWWNRFLLTSLEIFDYLPEIRYKSVVIRQESWNIRPQLGNTNFEEFEQWFLDNYSYLSNRKLALSYADNELIININNRRSRYLLYKQYLRTKSIQLVRVYDDCSALNSTEIVIPFQIDRATLDEDKSGTNLPNVYRLECCHPSNIMLADEWLSFEIYGCYDVDAYLSQELAVLLKDMRDNNIFESFFYLQYADPRYHIRLRLRKKNILNNIEYIIERLNKHVSGQLIETYNISPYDREIERYGGYDGMDNAERVFEIDSVCSLFLIKEKTVEEKEMYYVLSILEYLKMWNWDAKQQMDWLEANTGGNYYGESWRKQRRSYYICFSENIVFLPTELSLKKADAIQNYRLQHDYPFEIQERILASLIHMSFNRLFGMKKNKEKKLLAYSRNLLREIIARKKQ